MARILAQIGVRAVGQDGQAARLAQETRPWYLWPENLTTWNVWCRVQTQWRVGMAGATGLDYGAVMVVIDQAGVHRRRRAEVFEQIQDMERVALDVMDEKRESESKSDERNQVPAGH